MEIGETSRASAALNTPGLPRCQPDPNSWPPKVPAQTEGPRRQGLDAGAGPREGRAAERARGGLGVRLLAGKLVGSSVGGASGCFLRLRGAGRGGAVLR